MTSTESSDTVDEAVRNDTIRQLRRLRWSTRKIADHMGLSQSTIVRILHRLNTEPRPASLNGAGAPTDPMPRIYPGTRPRHRRIEAVALWVIAVAILALAAAAGALAWRAWRTAPAVPAPAPAAKIIACVQYGHQGWDNRYLTGLRASQAGACPASWKLFVLSPGS